MSPPHDEAQGTTSGYVRASWGAFAWLAVMATVFIGKKMPVNAMPSQPLTAKG